MGSEPELEDGSEEGDKGIASAEEEEDRVGDNAEDDDEDEEEEEEEKREGREEEEREGPSRRGVVWEESGRGEVRLRWRSMMRRKQRAHPSADRSVGANILINSSSPCRGDFSLTKIKHAFFRCFVSYTRSVMWGKGMAEEGLLSCKQQSTISQFDGALDRSTREKRKEEDESYGRLLKVIESGFVKDTPATFFLERQDLSVVNDFEPSTTHRIGKGDILLHLDLIFEDVLDVLRFPRGEKRQISSSRERSKREIQERERDSRERERFKRERFKREREFERNLIELFKELARKVFGVVDAAILCDKLRDCHFALDGGIVDVGVEHDGRKGEDVKTICRFKHFALALLKVLSGKCFHQAVDLLSFSGQTERVKEASFRVVFLVRIPRDQKEKERPRERDLRAMSKSTRSKSRSSSIASRTLELNSPLSLRKSPSFSLSMRLHLKKNLASVSGE